MHIFYPFMRINIHAEIRTKGNNNIKNSLIRCCDTDKNRMDKVRRIKYMYTHKRKHSLSNPIYCLTKETLQQKNQSCFIQAVISSNYVEINKQIFFAVSCFEGLSNFVQRYYQTGENQGRNLTSRMPYFKLDFPEDMETLKDKEGTR